MGFIPNREQFATHARYRYRIRKKDGQHGLFNPSLWLVHYRPSDPQFRIPVQNIPLHPAIHQILNERHMIQQQGVLERKPFMLPDRNAWPQVAFPGRPRMPTQQQFPINQAPGFYPGGPQPVVGPPAKRPRQAGPAQMPGATRAPPMLPHDLELEEAEDTAAGDFLDYITPATISRMRFKTHHLWFEEVFSSLYSISHILPEDLGFGLVGELGDITKDILNTPSTHNLKANLEDTRNLKQTIPKPTDKELVYKPLEPEQMQSFEKRVAEFVERKQREMDEMRERHGKIMGRINKGKIYLDAEERLREAGTDMAKIDEIVREVELSMGISLEERKDVVCVQAGPTQEDEESDKQLNGTSINGNGQFDDVNSTGLADSAAGLLDEFTSAADLPSGGQPSAAPSATAEGLDLMDDMDMDVDIAIPQPDTDVDQPADAAKAEDEWVVVENQEQEQVEKPQPATTEPPAAEAPAPVDAEKELNLGTATVDDTQVHNGEGTDAVDLLQPESMFDGGDFDSFEGMEGANYDDDDTGDGLLDFDGGFGSVEGEGGS
jgi:hypothetical protein